MRTEINPEQLQQRADIIIQSLSQSFEQGLLPETVARLHAEKRQRHQDLMLVYLGIKPASTFLQEVFEVYHSESADYLMNFPDAIGSERIQYSLDKAMVWNAQLSADLIDNNSVLLDQALLTDPRLMALSVHPENPDLALFLERLAVGSQSPKVYLEGLLLGYPQRASELFAEFGPQIGHIVMQYRDEAVYQGIRTSIPERFNLHSLLSNQGDIQNEAVRLFNKLGNPARGVKKFLQTVHFADVPGLPYATVNALTAKEDQAFQQAYAHSLLEDKLANLLSSY